MEGHGETETPGTTGGQAARAPPSAARFTFLDGLRGFAAVCIASYHIWRYEPAPYPAEQVVPKPVIWMLEHAWVGVQMLLVLSGFVIAYTLRDTVITPRTAIAFFARRLVRLTPPYWVTISAVVLLHGHCVTWGRFPSPLDDPLSAAGVLAQMFYLQDILGYPNLSAGLWTVAIEVQFYVVFAIAWGLSQRIAPGEESEPVLMLDVRRVPSFLRKINLLVFFALPAAWALFQWNRQDANEQWVHHFLFQFFLGMVTWWALDRIVPVLMFAGTIAVVLSQVLFDDSLKSEDVVARAVTLTTIVTVFMVGRTNHLHDWLNWRWLQYLGRISYSLYLVHYPVSHVVTWFGWLACDNSPTPTQATAILLASLAASIGVGHLVYLAVEVPSNRWAARLKSKSAPVTVASSATERRSA